MILDFGVHAEGNREEKEDVDADLQAHDKPTGFILTFHDHHEEANEGNKEAAENVQSNRDPPVGNDITERGIGCNGEIIEELLAEEFSLVAGT